MSTKKVLVAIPPRLLEQLDLLATYRCQTRSELIREAIRATLEQARARQLSAAVVPFPAVENQLTK